MLARGCSGDALNDEELRDGGGRHRHGLRAKLGAALGAARVEPDGLARGCSGGAVDDEAPRDGDSRHGLRAKLGAAREEPDGRVATAAALSTTKRHATAMAEVCFGLCLEQRVRSQRELARGCGGGALGNEAPSDSDG